jgi:hypothetical protein
VEECEERQADRRTWGKERQADRRIELCGGGETSRQKDRTVWGVGGGGETGNQKD